MSDTDALRRMMLAVERLESSADAQARQAHDALRALQQAHAAQAGLAAEREVEEARLKQAMAQMFQEQQRQAANALRPVVGRAWLGLGALAAGFVLVYVGLLVMVRHEQTRLQEARARADAAAVSAEVLQASRHVEISSCGGRPCIRIDRDTPTWKSQGGEFVLVDGQGP